MSSCKQIFVGILLACLVTSTLSFSKPSKHFTRNVHVHRALTANYFSDDGNAIIGGDLFVRGKINNNGIIFPSGVTLSGDVAGLVSATEVKFVGGQGCEQKCYLP